MKILLGGDVMLGRGVNQAIREVGDPREIWGDLLPVFRSADFRIVNLECAVTLRTEIWKKTPKAFYFRADPPALGVLQAAEIDACCLANNHSLDFDTEGLVDTLLSLDAAGIQHAGAGLDLEQASRGTILTSRSVPPKNVGFFAATDNEPDFAATQDGPGTRYFPIDLDVETLSWIGDQTRDLRARGAEVVVFSMHWGPNMVSQPNAVFRRFAQAAIDRGVDVFHGHSAHCFQGVEIYRDRPILYDTGDLLDDYVVDPTMRNDWSFLFLVRFDSRRLVDLELVPVSLDFAQVRSAQGRDRDKMIQRMQKQSLELGTELRLRPDGRLGICNASDREIGTYG